MGEAFILSPMTSERRSRLRALGALVAVVLVALVCSLAVSLTFPGVRPTAVAAPAHRLVSAEASQASGEDSDDGGEWEVGWLDWPTYSRVDVVRPFDPPEHKRGRGHRGVDLDYDGVVFAPADGTILYAGKIAGKPVISLDHGPFRTTYEPVEAWVMKGDQVRRGEPIGRVVDRHCGFPCLHWGAKIGKDHYLNPLALTGDVKVVLKE